MSKERKVAIFLKVVALIIISIGVYLFFEYRLWRDIGNEFISYLRVFIPILVLGFSSTLYGIATLLNKSKK